jgi:hypothetical protein
MVLHRALDGYKLHNYRKKAPTVEGGAFEV